MTGGRLFRISEMGDMGDIATRISAELRNEYVIGYRPSEVKRDGNWRKLKVRLAAAARPAGAGRTLSTGILCTFAVSLQIFSPTQTCFTPQRRPQQSLIATSRSLRTPDALPNRIRP